MIRRRFELELGEDAVVPSFSSRTIVYKGMLTAPQLRGYYPDLLDERTETALALVHSRFSTNTFPSWGLAHPYRMIAHNGEINTVRGNINWMRARESQLGRSCSATTSRRCCPVVQEGGSDSATLDNVLELLVLAGRSLPHAMMMMIPEATEGRAELSPELLGFYAYHQCLMEAWDGPAAVSFTDGRVIGATLDRNGLRPGRWLETSDGWVVLASETGVLDIPAENILRKGRLQPGKLFLVDLERGPDRPRRGGQARGRDAEAVRAVVRARGRPPRGPATARAACPPDGAAAPAADRVRLLTRGHEGDPRPARAERRGGGQLDGERHAARGAFRSAPARLLVLQAALRAGHEPPIDSIREAIVMSLQASIGSEKNLFDERPEHARQLVLPSPVLDDSELEQLRQVHSAIFKARTLDMTWPVAEGAAGIDLALVRLCREADEALAEGINVLILSDRAVGAERTAVPSLLATGAVHHHLVRNGTRLQAGLVVESGEARSVHSSRL